MKRKKSVGQKSIQQKQLYQKKVLAKRLPDEITQMIITGAQRTGFDPFQYLVITLQIILHLLEDFTDNRKAIKCHLFLLGGLYLQMQEKANSITKS